MTTQQIALPTWDVLADQSTEHWLELVDPGGWYHAVVKRDGCVHFRRYFNDPRDSADRNPDDEDYFHICDLDEEIARLQALRAKAIEFFGADWVNQ